MIEWEEEGVLLVSRPHGETAAIAEVFTREHGRHAGIVRGGTSKRMAPVLQPGNQVLARWSARLEDHLGAFALEPIRGRAAGLMADRAALAGLG
ncbi:MAG: recombination protein O N-terminal domain-containing protein, partial [Pseudomonadota bacterium]